MRACAHARTSVRSQHAYVCLRTYVLSGTRERHSGTMSSTVVFLQTIYYFSLAFCKAVTNYVAPNIMQQSTVS